jgi:hypothetical protein
MHPTQQVSHICETQVVATMGMYPTQEVLHTCEAHVVPTMCVWDICVCVYVCTVCQCVPIQNYCAQSYILHTQGNLKETWKT